MTARKRAKAAEEAGQLPIDPSSPWLSHLVLVRTDRSERHPRHHSDPDPGSRSEVDHLCARAPHCRSVRTRELNPSRKGAGCPDENHDADIAPRASVPSALGLSAGAFVLGLLAHCQEFAMGCFSSCFASLAASVGQSGPPPSLSPPFPLAVSPLARPSRPSPQTAY